jgi:acyl-CoA reductase-like NAD-dependent aldehyde dehydrogenase
MSLLGISPVSPLNSQIGVKLTLSVIGSEPVGKKVASAAAEMMIPTCIELGGKDPAFLLPSADIDFFASTLLRGV